MNDVRERERERKRIEAELDRDKQLVSVSVNDQGKKSDCDGVCTSNDGKGSVQGCTEPHLTGQCYTVTCMKREKETERYQKKGLPLPVPAGITPSLL
jgi:hypothetical protein